MRPRNMTRLGSFLALVVLAAMAVPVLAADDDKDSKGNVTGTWKWSFQTQQGDTRESTAKLKQDGEKVTGTISGRQGGNDTEIKDAQAAGIRVDLTIQTWGMSPVTSSTMGSMCARNSAIEPNRTVPWGSLASIDPSA